MTRAYDPRIAADAYAVRMLGRMDGRSGYYQRVGHHILQRCYDIGWHEGRSGMPAMPMPSAAPPPPRVGNPTDDDLPEVEQVTVPLMPHVVRTANPILALMANRTRRWP